MKNLDSSFGHVRHPEFALNPHVHPCTSATCEVTWVCFGDCGLPEKATCPTCTAKREAAVLGMDDQST